MKIIYSSNVYTTWANLSNFYLTTGVNEGSRERPVYAFFITTLHSLKLSLKNRISLPLHYPN
jgi:hypothetical protein